MADVAMGETPTHGKIKVNLSPTSAPSQSLESGRNVSGGDAPSGSECKGNCYKSVEWYGTIRLLVFLRTGESLRHAIRVAALYSLMEFNLPCSSIAVIPLVCW